MLLGHLNALRIVCSRLFLSNPSFCPELTNTSFHFLINEKARISILTSAMSSPYIRPAIFVFYNKVSGTGGFIFRAWLRKKNEFKVS